MKKIFVFLLFVISFQVLAVGPVINPAETPQHVMICDKPLEYTDDSVIQVGEMTELRLYQSSDGVTYSQDPVQTIDGQGACRFVVDTTQLPAGQYYYVATAVAGAESVNSNSHPFEIQRIPKPVTGLRSE